MNPDKFICFHKRNDTQNNEGKYAVRLKVTKNRQRRYINLKLFAAADEWDTDNEVFIVQRNVRGEKQRAENELRQKNNALIDRYRQRAREVIDEFDRQGVDWTLNQFETAFLHRAKRGKVKEYLENHIEVLRQTGHIGNANCYASTLRMLELYDGKLNQRLFSEIDIKYVKGFDVFLQQRRHGERETGCSGNTRKYYFKALRAILNKAIQDKEASEHTYPFGKGGFQIAKLEETTEKRYLPAEYLEKIKTTPGQTKQTEYARKLFLLSYYLYGMSFVDMAHLTRGNVVKRNDGDYIVYKRQKIKHQKNVRPIPILITEQIQGLMTELTGEKAPLQDYLLPIITVEGLTGEQLYNHVKGRYHKYNAYLNNLAKELNFEGIKLTTYVSRHTMAMTLQGQKQPREVISKMLGHHDLKTTNTYLDEFETHVLNEAAKVL